MNIINKLNTPFFLTGGTALSRHYFNHRYSDDLDLFVADNAEYHAWVEKIFETFFNAERQGTFILQHSTMKRLKEFAQIFIAAPEEPENILKVDFVNDVAARYGALERNNRLGAVDSWRNILSNKISALFRFEPRDIADVWTISKHKAFNWKTILEEAKTKEAGVEPEIVYNIIRSFPVEQFEVVKWVKKPDYRLVKLELAAIADDLFYGRNNSLVRI
jgi:predicted nucleotidyltransferase component of viral defense system